MSGTIPDAARPSIEAHIAAFYGRKDLACDVEPYVVDVTTGGKSVKFFDLVSDDGTTASGTGKLVVAADGKFGILFIEVDQFESKNVISTTKWVLPESMASQLKPDGSGGFILQG